MGNIVLVERLYLKEHFGFEEVVLSFRNSLIVFTGPSGAGKSVLINALLALFGMKNPEAKVSEIVVQANVDLERFGIESEEDIVIIRSMKKEKSRYFINEQSISKKSLQELFSPMVSYLNQKDQSFFASTNILNIIDDFVESEEFVKNKLLLQELYQRYIKTKKHLEEIEQKEQKSQELREFLEFEIAKIDRINPQVGEYEELMQVKKELSKKEKIAQALQRAENIFEYESAVQEALDLIGKSSDFFNATMNELRDIFYAEATRLEELEEVDIETVLSRIEELSSLKRRYGSIEEAIEQRKKKKEELEALENISFEKEHLQKELDSLQQQLQDIAASITKARKEAAKRVQERVNEYLHQLKLPAAAIAIENKNLDASGADEAEVLLNGVNFKNISSGEYNRLRLAFMAAWSDVGGKKGILVLDEIDANISGEESMAVAKILKKLSSNYQIFAISHQAQLASLADQHFLVTKENGKSSVKEIEEEQRVEEIARIISGEKITQEAKDFAKKLLKESI
ncbi:AAA family ATPase [Nitratiruptor tergarcus]|uniref:AAA family ATPase n=1 Tax=Nitratiruptor tergarcus TaxID=269259 RepID=UPI0009FC811C|nr:AAA family ATPase [Nitratiruptor tergarcus]